MRGRRDMRGGMRMPFKKPAFMPRPPFDLTRFDMAFYQKDSPSIPDDTELTNVNKLSINCFPTKLVKKTHSENIIFKQALLKRNQDLTPNPSDLTALSNLVTKIQNILENLVIAPGDFNTCVSINTVPRLKCKKRRLLTLNFIFTAIGRGASSWFVQKRNDAG